MQEMPTSVTNETKVLVYAKEGDHFGNTLKEITTGILPEANMEIYGILSGLLSRLRIPQPEFDIAVLLASDEEDQESILSLRPFLETVRIILVLPNRKTSSVRTGHSLHPRYLSFKDGPVSDVKSVLIRMIEAENRHKTILGGDVREWACDGKSGESCSESESVVVEPGEEKKDLPKKKDNKGARTFIERSGGT